MDISIKHQGIKDKERENTRNYSKSNATLEIRALVGILTLSAVMKDDHLSTDEVLKS